MAKIDFDDLWHPTNKQKIAREAVRKYRYVLFGGAMGGGKSYFLRWELIDLLTDWAQRGYKHVRVALFCEDFPALRDRHLSRIKYEFPEWLGKYNKADHEYVLDEAYGGGAVCFRNLDDPSKYQSSEFAAEAVDELTKDPIEAFRFLRTRLRWADMPLKETKFIAGTNPGGIGHAWVKRYWIDKDFPPYEQEKDQFYFVPSKATDNPHLDKSYYKQLDSLPPRLRRAYVDGDWNVFKGQYFSEWRQNIHVWKHMEIDKGWKRFVAIDYGYSAPSAAYWLAVDYDGNVYVYRELYQTQLTYRDLAKEIIARSRDENIDYWVADPAIWAKHGEELSGAEIMEEEYLKETGKALRLEKGNNDRVIGWNLFREYLKPIKPKITYRNGKRKYSPVRAKLRISGSRCPHAVKTIPTLVFDPHNPEDLDTRGEDHAADAIRYGLMSRVYPSERREEHNEGYKEKLIKRIWAERDDDYDDEIF